MKRFLLGFVSLFFSVALAVSQAIPAVAQTTPPIPEVLIVAVQTGASSTTNPSRGAYDEYVEIYNQSGSSVDVAGWTVTYSTSNDTSPRLLATLAGTLEAESFVLLASRDHAVPAPDTADYAFAYAGGMPETGGHVTIKNSAGAVVDRLGWGTAIRPEGFEAKAAPSDAAAAAPVRGQVIARCSLAGDSFQDTNDNVNDFRLTTPLHFQTGPRCQPDPLPDDQEQPPVITGPAPSLTCEGVMITELLPNPVGPDSGKEFIELHNPTNEVISLSGCALQLAGSTKTYAFHDVAMQPDEYRAFSDTETGLTLPNSAGGTVWLLSPTEELQTVTYPGELDDVSWALTDGAWHYTYNPTIAQSNVIVAVKPCPAGQVRNSQTNRCYTPAASASQPADCKPGQERNPATNRCRSTAAASSSLTPCPPGQERNAVTNRCRSAVASTVALLPCKPGQERNPATNRCRSATAAASTLKLCAEGQERNPETNRCRKVASPSSGVKGLSTVQDVPAASATDKARWLVAGAIVLAAIGYGAYEWRNDLRLVLARLRRKPLTHA